MGNRLSKIYTRTGDDGSTGLADGSRVAKTDPRVEAMGAIDELNSTIGLLICSVQDAETSAILLDAQHTLFDIGGELAIPGHLIVEAATVVALEAHLDRLNDDLEPLKEFILPGGSEAAARCHVARSVCRRAERRLCSVALIDAPAGDDNSDSAVINPQAQKFVNRLSDFLFVLARTLNRHEGVADVLWRHTRRSS